MNGAQLTEALLWLAKGEKGLDRKRLSARAKIGYNTIGEWLHGKSSPTLDNFIALTEAAGYTVPHIWERAEKLAELRGRLGDLAEEADKLLDDAD